MDLILLFLFIKNYLKIDVYCTLNTTTCTAWKWIVVYVYAWLVLQSVYTVCTYVGEERCLDDYDYDYDPRGQTHSKAPQSSVLNLRVSPLHLACRQQSVSRLTLAVSTKVMFPGRKTT